MDVAAAESPSSSSNPHFHLDDDDDDDDNDNGQPPFKLEPEDPQKLPDPLALSNSNNNDDDVVVSDPPPAPDQPDNDRGHNSIRDGHGDDEQHRCPPHGDGNDHGGDDGSPTSPEAKTELEEQEKNKDDDDDHNSNNSPSPPDLGKVSQEIDRFISSSGDVEYDEHPPPDLPLFVEQFLDLVEAQTGISQDPSSSSDHHHEPPLIKWSRLTQDDAASFLEAASRVSSLSRALLRFQSEQKYASCINRLGRILQQAMSYLEEEFKSLLEDHKAAAAAAAGNVDHSKSASSSSSSSEQHSSAHQNHHAPPPPADGEPEPEPDSNSASLVCLSGYNPETLSDLIRLSKALVAGGYETECCQAYSVARRNALEETLHTLGFEKHSIDDVQKMQWGSLEREIQAWIRALRQWETLHVPSERKLSDTVFSDYPAMSQALFGSLSHGVTTQLFNFSAALALTRRGVEKLFKFLDVYEALRDSVPEIGELMPQEWGTEIKSEASMIRSSLGQAMILMFSDLERSIKGDAGKTPVPAAGGGVHPLTIYTTDFLENACEYKATLDQVFSEHRNYKLERAEYDDDRDRDHEGGDDQYLDHQDHQNQSDQSQSQSQSRGGAGRQPPSSPFQGQITKVMELLEQKVERKSKLYKEPALSSIFLMNNGRYVLKKVRESSELNSLMGEAWYRKKSADLRQYHQVYQRETWGRLLGCFRASDGLVVNGKVSKPVLKERFKSFNAMFDEIHRAQSGWVVADEQLQSELRVAISNMVIPAYRSYLGRYSHTFTPGRQTEKYVKYQPEDIEACIEDLFDGNTSK
ncbi:exocyst complex component EXO70B1-like [Andrographis paniculata]|uniref:exocyst complex component EXO70B1-like n=1 Tax=Andrographis paniculata TaxID=175694 RepID=UPI0021E99C6B|nr:exocyst complex component EXO70B1-like [Andrographis paniculata]